MGRRFAILLAMMVLLSGCKATVPVVKPAEQPPVAAEPPATVEPAVPEGPCLNRPPDGNHARLNNEFVGQGLCAMVVDSEDVWVDFVLDPAVPVAAARSALVVNAPTEPEVRVTEPDRWNDYLWLQVHFSPGAPGEHLEVRLSGPLGPGSAPVDFGFSLERVPTPGVIVEWRPVGEGEWRALDRVAGLPRAALDLRFRTQGKVPTSIVESNLRHSGIAAGGWQDGESTVRTLAEPPGHLLLNLDGIRNEDGLKTAHSLWELFFGAPPQFTALDPVTGAKRVIGRAPFNVDRGAPSPDGRWVVLFAVNTENPYVEDAWVADTATDQVLRVDTQTVWPRFEAYWSGSELLLVNGGRIAHWHPDETNAQSVQTRSSGYFAISPDGQQLAGLTFDYNREDEHWLAPGTIVLYDVSARKERLVAVDKVRVRIPHSGAQIYLWMEFVADGKALLIREPLPDEFTAYHWIRLDLETQALTEPVEFEPRGCSDWLRSPGGYLVQRRPDYAPVSVKAPDGTVKAYGEGRVLDWMSDGSLLLIRWEHGADLRRVWSGE